MSSRPAEVEGQVLAVQRRDVSKRSDRQRWVLRVDLDVGRWQWLEDSAEDAPGETVPCHALCLVSPESRWQRMLARSPKVGDVLRCRINHDGGSPIEPLAVAFGRSIAERSKDDSATG